MAPQLRRALALALACLMLCSAPVVSAASFIQNQTGPVPQRLSPSGWRFLASSNTQFGESVCLEVHPVDDPGSFVRQECTFVSYDAGSGVSQWQCDIFTGGYPAAFRSATVEYQYFIASSGSSCTSNTYGFTGFGMTRAFGNTNGNPNFTTGPTAVRLTAFEGRQRTSLLPLAALAAALLALALAVLRPQASSKFKVQGSRFKR